MIEYVKITSLEEVNFDYLFNQSLQNLDNNFIWGPGIVTDMDKLNAYKTQIISAMNNEWAVGRNSTDVFFMYKTVVDGQDLELSAGFIEGTIFKGRWNLSSVDSTGSKNWIYTTDNREARKAFYNNNGLTSYAMYTFVGSELYNFIRYRASAGNFTISAEFPTIEGDNPKNLVTLIIDL